MKNITESILKLNAAVSKCFLVVLILAAYAPFSYADFKEIILRNDSSATSELPDPDSADEEDYYAINEKYGVQNLFDGNNATAWVEGVKGYGTGEAVFMSLPDECSVINIFNGYGKSKTAFENNGRVKRLKLTCFAGVHREIDVTEIADAYKVKQFPEEYFIDLEDKFAVQSFMFPFKIKELKEFQEKFVTEFKKTSDDPILSVKIILRLEIADVYKGSKYEDTCISEIFFNNTVTPETKPVK